MSCPTFVTPWTAARQASLSFTISQSLLKLTSIELVMLSNHLILFRPLLLLPSIFPSIRVFSIESTLRIRWSRYWSFSFSISLSNEYSGLIFLFFKNQEVSINFKKSLCFIYCVKENFSNSKIPFSSSALPWNSGGHCPSLSRTDSLLCD